MSSAAHLGTFLPQRRFCARAPARARDLHPQRRSCSSGLCGEDLCVQNLDVPGLHSPFPSGLLLGWGVGVVFGTNQQWATSIPDCHSPGHCGHPQLQPRD